MNIKVLFRTVLIGIIFFGITYSGKSQDPIYSNTFVNNINTNPAYAGSKEMLRVSFNNQLIWLTAIHKHTVNSFSADFAYEKFGFGLGGTYNSAGSVFKYTDIDAAVSYRFGDLRKIIFRPGIKFSYLNKSIDRGKLVFYDQLSVYDGVFTANSAAPQDFANANLFDVSAGFVMQMPLNIRRTAPAWLNIGFSVNHIPKHDLSAVGITENIYPRKYILNAGVFIPLFKKDKITKFRTARKLKLYPNFKYQKHGNFASLDNGVILYRSPFLLGVAYRSFPNIDISNKRQLLGTIGFEKILGTYLNLQVLYSIDWAVTMANKKEYTPNFVTHEFSIIILFANKRKTDCSSLLKFNKKRWYKNEMQRRHKDECPPGKTPRRTAQDAFPVFYPFELPQPYIDFEH